METEEMKKEILNTINKEETIKIKLAETLKETMRLAGEFRLNSKIYDDEELNKILEKGAESLKEFNKELAAHISKL
jgi:hypothetical protein